MSGFPNMEEIGELRDALAVVAREHETIEAALVDAQRIEKVRVEAISRQQAGVGKVHDLMRSMDCDAPGNSGYHNRLFALLTGLAQHAADAPAAQWEGEK